MKLVANQKKNFFNFDKSFYSLLITNIITIILAVFERWNLITIMFIYLGQSIIIGVFNFIRIITLKEFSTENFTINNKEVLPTSHTKYFTAFFFAFHYGIFHFGYFIFLIGSYLTSESRDPIYYILFGWLIFFINHLFSYRQNKDKDLGKKPNIGRLMFFPYARIIPMHITIVFGLIFANSTFAIVFFLVLKSLADLIMHQIEHS